MYAKINSVTIFPEVATQLHINSAAILGFGDLGSVNINWSLNNDNGKSLKYGNTKMSREQYLTWSGKDSDLFTWLASQLNLTIQEIIDQ